MPVKWEEQRTWGKPGQGGMVEAVRGTQVMTVLILGTEFRLVRVDQLIKTNPSEFEGE